MHQPTYDTVRQTLQDRQQEAARQRLAAAVRAARKDGGNARTWSTAARSWLRPERPARSATRPDAARPSTGNRPGRFAPRAR